MSVTKIGMVAESSKIIRLCVLSVLCEKNPECFSQRAQRSLR
jgi:hypothetical protein